MNVSGFQNHDNEQQDSRKHENFRGPKTKMNNRVPENMKISGFQKHENKQQGSRKRENFSVPKT